MLSAALFELPTFLYWCVSGSNAAMGRMITAPYIATMMNVLRQLKACDSAPPRMGPRMGPTSCSSSRQALCHTLYKEDSCLQNKREPRIVPEGTSCSSAAAAWQDTTANARKQSLPHQLTMGMVTMPRAMPRS
jgi:hypothetical protein